MKTKSFKVAKQLVTTTTFKESREMRFAGIDDNGEPKRFPREMQIEALNAWTTMEQAHLFISACTASGKTLGAKFIFGPEMDADPEMRVIIIVPVLNIATGYAKSETLTYGNTWDFTDHVWDVNEVLDFTKGNHTQSKVSAVCDWFGEPVVKGRRIAIMSQVTFSRAVEIAGDEIENMCINTDEFHHSAHDGEKGNRLGNAMNRLLARSKQRNIRFLVTTATPSRTDSVKLFGDEYKDDFANYEYTVTRYFEDSPNIKGFDYTFHPTPEDWLALATNKRHVWFQPRRTNKTKTIVFMPGEMHKKITQEKKQENVQNFLNAIADGEDCTRLFDDNGICTIKIGRKNFVVMNLVEKDWQKSGIDYLAENPDAVDILLSVKIFSEGSDWPPANNAIVFGQRRSLVEMIQFFGRIMRRHDSKVGDGRIVNIHHALPKIDLEATPRDSYNDMLKAINLAMLFVSTSMPMEYTIINPPTPPEDDGDDQPIRFNHIQEVMRQLGDNAVNKMENVLLDVAHVTADVASEYEGDSSMSTADINRETIAKLEHMLENKWNITTKTRQIAERFVLVAAHTVALNALAGFDEDVSNLDYNLLSDHLAADFYMCGIEHKAFAEWYTQVYKAGETEAIRKTEWLVIFHREYGRFPTKKDRTSLGEEAYSMLLFLYSMRGAKIGTADDRTWYPKCEEIAIAADLPDMFKQVDRKQLAIEKAIRVFDLMDILGKTPSFKSDNAEERMLAESIGARRKAKLAYENNEYQTKAVWYPELQEIAEERGYPDIFASQGHDYQKQKDLAFCVTVCKLADKLGRIPVSKKGTKSKEEVFTGSWITRKRSARNGNHTAIWYDELDTIAAENGYPDLFISRLTGKALAAEKVKKFNAWYKVEKRKPSYKKPEDKEIFKIYRMIKDSKSDDCSAIYYDVFDELDLLIETPSHGERLTSIAAEKVKKFNAWYKVEKREPSYKKPEDKEIFKIYRMIKDSKSDDCSAIYYDVFDELDLLIETPSHGERLTSIAAEKVKKFNAWYKVEKREPSYKAKKNTEEKQAHLIYQMIKSAKSGTGTAKWYDVFDELDLPL